MSKKPKQPRVDGQTIADRPAGDGLAALQQTHRCHRTGTAKTSRDEGFGVFASHLRPAGRAGTSRLCRDGVPRSMTDGVLSWFLPAGYLLFCPAHEYCPDLSHGFFLGFPRAGMDNVAETGPVAVEERFLSLPARSVGIRLRLQLAVGFPAPVNVLSSPPRNSWLG